MYQNNAEFYADFETVEENGKKLDHWVHRSIWVLLGTLVESKFARNGLTIRKTFLTNIFKNIIWHVFTGESYQAVKITVT
jgi:hypothetical protein